MPSCPRLQTLYHDYNSKNLFNLVEYEPVIGGDSAHKGVSPRPGPASKHKAQAIAAAARAQPTTAADTSSNHNFVLNLLKGK